MTGTFGSSPFLLRPALRRTTTVWTCLVFAFLATALGALHSSSANAAESLSISAQFLEDAGNPLNAEQALAQLRQGNGSTLPGSRFNQGNRDSHFWIYFKVVNKGTNSDDLLLDTGVPFRAGLTTYLLRAGAEQPGDNALILDTGDTQPFGERLTDAITLHSDTFSLNAGEQVEFLLDYHTRGATYMPLSLTPVAEFQDRQQQEALWAALFYAACTIIIMLVFMFGIAMKAPPVLMYACLFFSGLLMIAANEGYGYQFLWPNAPGWNQYAGLFLVLFTTALSFVVARYAMDPSAITQTRARILLSLAALSFALALLCSTLPFSPLIDIAGILMLLSYLAQVLTISSWLRAAVKRNLVSLASILIVLPVIGLLLVLSILGFDLPDMVIKYSSRAIYLFAILSTLAAQIIHIMALRIDHENSLEASLVAARRDAEMNRALLESEQKYTRARELAHRRKEQLATTSHDIRQPLTSLRAILDRRLENMDPAEQDTLKKSLAYIEELSQAPTTQDDDSYSVNSEADNEAEPYRADLLLKTVSRMFEAEAEARGIALRMMPCSVLLNQTPLAIMRILTNLTANAIKHCTSGSVLLGCRRGEQALSFQVIDTGAGIAAEDLERLWQPYEKGEDSQGEGLGLAICWQLAAENGFKLTVSSTPGRGSCFALNVPVSTSPVPGSAMLS